MLAFLVAFIPFEGHAFEFHGLESHSALTKSMRSNVMQMLNIFSMATKMQLMQYISLEMWLSLDPTAIEQKKCVFRGTK